MDRMTTLERITWESCGTVGIGTQLMEVVSMCNYLYLPVSFWNEHETIDYKDICSDHLC
jgi:hypothetical protein